MDILVATPGRLFDLKSQGHVILHRVEILVLDEADHMLDLGFIKDIQDLGRSLPRKRQTLFFTATLDQDIKDIAYSLVRNAIRIQISPKNPVARNIDHSVAYIEMDDKRFFLERLVKENPEKKCIVFVRTIVRAERVVKAMARVGIEAEAIHREKSESERAATLAAFKEGVFNLLIATDISARGIDIPGITLVINYDLPTDPEMYVHRVGRTGRAKARGTAISFCSPTERSVQGEIETFLDQPIKVLDIHKKEYEQVLELTKENTGDWRSLMQEAEESGFGKGKKKARKSPKKKNKKKKP